MMKHIILKNIKTIDDIITFIDATVSFIDSDLAAIKAEKLISSRQNK